MISSCQILVRQLRAMGADGLCNPGATCGCGLDDLAPCDCLNLSECVAAKWTIPKPGEPEYQDEDYRGGYFVEIFPPSQAKSDDLWESYQANQSYENCCRWLKHRAYVGLAGGRRE